MSTDLKAQKVVADEENEAMVHEWENSGADGEDSGDDFFRSFRARVPTWIQSWMRDSGTVRFIMDTLVWTGIPALVDDYPWAVDDFLRLTGRDRAKKIVPFLKLNTANGENQPQPEFGEKKGLKAKDVAFSIDSYGADPRQFVYSISLPNDDKATGIRDEESESTNLERIITIVHGGAWGSGFPDMYALAATPFLNAGYSQVSIIGYRTFPTANVEGQIDDVVTALELIGKGPTRNVTVISHSSGSHLLALAFLENRLESMRDIIDQFVALAGVYDIPSHYQFERSRGVERVSPMAAACGYTLGSWKRNSPLRLAKAMGVAKSQSRFPRSSLVIHGRDDTTVPYESSEAFAEACGLRSEILHQTGHGDVVLQLMFGGRTRTVVLDWIQSASGRG